MLIPLLSLFVSLFAFFFLFNGVIEKVLGIQCFE